MGRPFFGLVGRKRMQNIEMDFKTKKLLEMEKYC
jgi:hypothetical protein